MEKMIIKPDSFSGQGDIKTFIRQYEKAAQINYWDDNEKIKFLSIFLKDAANEFLQNLKNKGGDLSWEKSKKRIHKRISTYRILYYIKRQIKK